MNEDTPLDVLLPGVDIALAQVLLRRADACITYHQHRGLRAMARGYGVLIDRHARYIRQARQNYHHIEEQVRQTAALRQN